MYKPSSIQLALKMIYEKSNHIKRKNPSAYIIHFYSIIDPSIIYNLYNVHVILILSTYRIMIIVSIFPLKSNNHVSKSTWLNWRHFSMLFLLKNSLPSVFKMDKIWLMIFKIVCFQWIYALLHHFSLLYTCITAKVYTGYFGKCATQFHHAMKLLWIIFFL